MVLTPVVLVKITVPFPDASLPSYSAIDMQSTDIYHPGLKNAAAPGERALVKAATVAASRSGHMPVSACRLPALSVAGLLPDSMRGFLQEVDDCIESLPAARLHQNHVRAATNLYPAPPGGVIEALK